MSKWLLIDGFNLAYRCFFAIPELTRKDGFPTNALHGWIKSIWRLQEQERPDECLVFFDLGGAQDRLALHPEYKAQRQEMPEALSKQVDSLKELSRLMGIRPIERSGVESDDVLASKAVALAGQGHEVLIVSSDKDFAQIVGERIRILLPPSTGGAKQGWRVLDVAGVVEKFGVPPAAIADYLAVMGDNADNIPGIKGVGPKTAVKWLERHGSLEGIIAGAEVLEPERFRAPVKAEAERLRLNRRLTTLNLSLSLEGTEPLRIEVAGLLAFLETMEMKGALAEARERYVQGELF